jgi:hypothetical protein
LNKIKFRKFSVFFQIKKNEKKGKDDRISARRMFKKKTVLSHHAPIDHDEHHNILWNKREKKTRERERKRIVRRQDTKQPTNLFFISSARLSIHQKKKKE